MHGAQRFRFEAAPNDDDHPPPPSTCPTQAQVFFGINLWPSTPPLASCSKVELDQLFPLPPPPLQLVVWREDDHSLTQLSKDHEKCEVFATEYLVDEPGMGIVVADGRRNLKVGRRK